MSSNVGSSLFIGLAGQAAMGGLAVGGYEWNVRMFSGVSRKSSSSRMFSIHSHEAQNGAQVYPFPTDHP